MATGITPSRHILNRLIHYGYLRSIMEEYGRYFGVLGATLDPIVKTFISHLDPVKFDKRPNDVRANRYYRRVFNGRDTPELNVLLTIFQGMLNFVESVIQLTKTPNCRSTLFSRYAILRFTRYFAA
jgi:hypothetical protein